MKKIISLLCLLALLPLRSGADLTATVQPGYVLAPGERPTTDTLNRLGQPTVTVSGTVTGTAGLAAGTVTGNLLSDSVVDDITIDFNGASPRQLEVKDGGIGVDQISTSIAGVGLSGGGGAPLSVTNGCPVGSVIMYAANSAPSGWLECNGAAVSRTTYAQLFSAIGTTFGAGDTTTTFNLPQLQGNFVRGWAHTETTNDNARVFGSWQQSTNAPHTHWIVNENSGNPHADPAPTSTTSVKLAGNVPGGFEEDYLLIGGAATPTVGLTSSSGNTESRPKNVALLFIIKY